MISSVFINSINSPMTTTFEQGINYLISNSKKMLICIKQELFTLSFYTITIVNFINENPQQNF